MGDSNKAKKIIGNVLKGGFEAVAESAKKVGETVSPTALVEHALGGAAQPTSEFTDFLKKQGPNLSPEELKKKQLETGFSDQTKLEQTRKMLKTSLPAHMQLPREQSRSRPYEAIQREEEEKKARMVEAQKTQPSALSLPVSKQSRGGLFGRKKKANTGFEGSVKDTKKG